ncbi:MAG: hypothetical protein PHP61_06270 [Candidatus Izemoplasmatales bacterium]|nr:hypothetical protein [Candidatus Izemoplasmatales bacterium]
MKRRYLWVFISLSLFTLTNCGTLTDLPTSLVATTISSTTAEMTSIQSTASVTTDIPTISSENTTLNNTTETLVTTLPSDTSAFLTTTLPTTHLPETTQIDSTSNPTLPVTTTTELTTTETNSFLSIAEILATQPSGTFLVHGTIYYVIATLDRPSYYIYDGSAMILVIDSQSVTIGDSVQFEATFDYNEPAPQLMNVSNFTASTAPQTMPSFESMILTDLAAHAKTNINFYGNTLTITGTLLQPMPGMFRLVSGENSVIINNKSFVSGNPLLPLVNQTVTINVVVHFYDDMMSVWHVLYQSLYSAPE